MPPTATILCRSGGAHTRTPNTRSAGSGTTPKSPFHISQLKIKTRQSHSAAHTEVPSRLPACSGHPSLPCCCSLQTAVTSKPATTPCLKIDFSSRRKLHHGQRRQQYMYSPQSRERPRSTTNCCAPRSSSRRCVRALSARGGSPTPQASQTQLHQSQHQSTTTATTSTTNNITISTPTISAACHTAPATYQLLRMDVT